MFVFIWVSLVQSKYRCKCRGLDNLVFSASVDIFDSLMLLAASIFDSFIFEEYLRSLCFYWFFKCCGVFD